MIDRGARMTMAGWAAGALAGLLEPLMGEGGSYIWPALAGTGLLIPLGVLLGLGLFLLETMLPPGAKPHPVFKALRSTGTSKFPSGILAATIGALVLLPIFFEMIFFFMTSFHHKGLAALSLSVAALFFVLISALAIRRLAILLGGVLDQIGRKLPLALSPIAVGVVCLILLASALVPPLATGPDATGPYGFVGLLRKDGLGAAPLGVVLALLVAIAILVKAMAPLGKKYVRLVAPAAVIFALLGPLWTSEILGAHPMASQRLDSAQGLSGLLSKAMRNLCDKDGDGHSAWMGGRDCDDTNPKVHPAAREIPDNGTDEDCNGEDLDTTKLRASAPPRDQAEKQELSPPSIPPDASLFIITVDALRWNEPGFMGYERKVTPNLDSFVKEGTIYERAYSLGSYTGQSIPPLLTGKYASELLRNDKHELRVSGKETFAAELICDEKVKCAAYLSHFLFDPHYGWSQGFDRWTVVGAAPAGPGHIDSKYNSHMVANQAIRWLEKPENTSGRFLFWTHFMDPHKEYLEHKGFKNFGESRRDRYDHEVLFTDHHIGRMLDAFRKLPAFKNTVFIVTSDHGEAFNEHGRWCHGKELWEEIIRVPMAVVGPGIPQKRITRQTSHIDFYPTLLDFFGVKIPEETHGRSLLPDWVEGQELPVRPVISDQPRNSHYESRRVYIADGWKLHVLPDTGSYRLFELNDDYERGESLVEARPERFKKMKDAYDLFSATALKPVDPVRWGAGPVEEMPLPDSFPH